MFTSSPVPTDDLPLWRDYILIWRQVARELLDRVQRAAHVWQSKSEAMAPYVAQVRASAIKLGELSNDRAGQVGHRSVPRRLISAISHHSMTNISRRFLRSAATSPVAECSPTLAPPTTRRIPAIYRAERRVRGRARAATSSRASSG